MAKRLKTIEYAFPILSGTLTAGNFANSGEFISPDISIWIPETGGRAFKSVILETTLHDNEGTIADDLLFRDFGVSCDGGTNYTKRGILNTLADTAENMSYIWTADVTSEFTNRFGAGATGFCRYSGMLGYVVPGQIYTNVCSKLYITYEYEDSLATGRIKTVRIPINSYSGRLLGGTPNANNTGSIPNLDEWLPETGKLYRDIFLEFWSNTCPSATVAYSLGVGFDATGYEFDSLHSGAARSSYTYRNIIKRPTLPTNQPHTIEVVCPQARLSAFANLGGWLTVTYEYDHQNSTGIMNSLIFGLGETQNNLQTVAQPYYSVFNRYFNESGIQELDRSAIVALVSSKTSPDRLYIGAGNQPFYSYPVDAQSSQAGQYSIVHRIDKHAHSTFSEFDRGTNGVLEWKRGYNYITGYFAANAVSQLNNMSAMGIINYVSAKHTSGDGVHNHTVFLNILDNQVATAIRTSTTTGIYIPEATESNKYNINGFMLLHDINFNGGAYGHSVTTESLVSAGEPINSAIPLDTSYGLIGSERTPVRSLVAVRDYYKRYPNDIQIYRISVTGNRSYIYDTNNTATFGAIACITYNSMFYDFNGRVVGYTGDGANINVSIIKTCDYEPVYYGTTIVGGYFSGTFYHGNNPLVAMATQGNLTSKTEEFILDNTQYIEININQREYFGIGQ